MDGPSSRMIKEVQAIFNNPVNGLIKY
jgi:hypothetical protein